MPPRYNIEARGSCGCLLLLLPIIITAAIATIATYLGLH